MTSETIVANAVLDLLRAAAQAATSWALIGGQALIVYGVPRETLDADALVPPQAMTALAETLVTTFGWTPLAYDDATADYVPAPTVTVHYMDDPVLFDVGGERQMIPLRSPFGLPVELLAAQHPVEQAMLDGAIPRLHHGVRVPVAPLGGVLLVKTKADRPKDVAAIEQTGEHLPASDLAEAVTWARKRDPATADDLEAILTAARVRRAPKRTTPYRRRK